VGREPGPVEAQPEVQEPIWRYLNRRVSDWRINTGRERVKQHAELSVIDLTRDLDRSAASTLLIDVVRVATARENAELLALAAALGPSARLVRAVEAHSLYTEGKVRNTRADEVARAIFQWIEK